MVLLASEITSHMTNGEWCTRYFKPFSTKIFSILGLCLSTSRESPISRWRMVWVLLSIKTAVLLFAEKPKLKKNYTKFSNIYFSCYPEMTTSFFSKAYTPNICYGNQFKMLINCSNKSLQNVMYSCIFL